MIVVGIGPDGDASAFDLEHWGLSAGNLDLLRTEEHKRFAAFVQSHGSSCGPPEPTHIAEAHAGSDVGRDFAFEFDRAAALPEERERTVALHAWARTDLIRMVENATEAHLDWADPDRALPDWAWWRTAREIAWHCVLTECFRYLGRLGIPLPTALDGTGRPFPVPETRRLISILHACRDHVVRSIHEVPSDIVVADDSGETWTTRKSLRYLAAHERGENFVTGLLLAKARARI